MPKCCDNKHLNGNFIKSKLYKLSITVCQYHVVVYLWFICVSCDMQFSRAAMLLMSTVIWMDWLWLSYYETSQLGNSIVKCHSLISYPSACLLCLPVVCMQSCEDCYKRKLPHPCGCHSSSMLIDVSLTLSNFIFYF